MNGYCEPVPGLVGTNSRWARLPLWGTFSSGAWVVANGATYVPIIVPTTCVARRMWWANGATVSASYNVEAGIYAGTLSGDPGIKVITTGSVAQGTASQVQFADITDTVLPPGSYWMFMSCSSTSATFMRAAVPAGGRWNELVILIQGSVAPGSAPATATPGEPESGDVVPLFGFATTASP